MADGVAIRYAGVKDRAQWFQLDRHLPEERYDPVVKDRRGYVLTADGKTAGILRYGLFWELIPFCHLVFIHCAYRGCGLGRQLMTFWEEDMRSKGYGLVMTSTQVDETAQHFYRKLGYRDCGGLLLDVPGYEQPMELFLLKALSGTNGETHLERE